jgi:hypothetical protein
MDGTGRPVLIIKPSPIGTQWTPDRNEIACTDNYGDQKGSEVRKKYSNKRKSDGKVLASLK